MRRAPVALALLLVLAFPVSASLIEDTLDETLEPTGLDVHYQEDATVAGDAPATCEAVDAARTVVLDGSSSPGMLVEHDDEVDAFAFTLGEETVGERVAVSVLIGLLVDRYDVAFDVRSPDCASSVFDPDSAYYDPAPADPYQPPLGETTFEAGLTGYDCNPGEWKFLGNQMAGVPAPADIYVEWSNGEWEYVPVVKSTPATIAMYVTSSNLDVTVERAVIVLPAWYKGQFNLVHGPCDAVEGTPEPAPVVDARYGEFTVQEAGQHVVIVYIEQGTVDKTQATVEALVADPPTSVAVNCHSDICTLAFDGFSYDVGSSLAA